MSRARLSSFLLLALAVALPTLAIVGLVIFLALVIPAHKGRRTLLPAPQAAPPEAAAAPVDSPVIEVPFTRFLYEYDNNPVAFFQQYSGRTVRIMGQVRDVGVLPGGRIEVLLSHSGPGSYGPFWISFPDPELAARMASFPIGDWVTVTVRIGPARQPPRLTALAVERP